MEDCRLQVAMQNKIVKRLLPKWRTSLAIFVMAVGSVSIVAKILDSFSGSATTTHSPPVIFPSPSQVISTHGSNGTVPEIASIQAMLPSAKHGYPPANLIYNVSTLPPFQPNAKLQAVVDNAVSVLRNSGLPTQSLSISLINLKGQNCCEYGIYADRTPRFPASVAKMFWMVALQAQIEHGLLSKDVISGQELYKMIQKSDNEPTSRVVDEITGADSGDRLNDEFLGIWAAKRRWTNRFFEAAGYQNINLSQKNFPVPALHLQQPEGRDLQIRGNQSLPIRNYLTTYDTARLLYEIHAGQSVSKEASSKMELLLKRDLRPEIWKKEEYNSIEGFLSESLPQNTYFISKVGWTSGSRQEAALIRSADGSVEYILVIFGDDRAYADDWKIFPKVSRLILDRMLADAIR